MSVRVQEADFSLDAEMAAMTGGNHAIGAVASFVGKVRGAAHARPLQSMALEHYPGMTEQELSRIEAEAVQRFKLDASLIIHRIGALRPGDNIVLVIACSAHRQDAFDACAFLMDYLKTRAPFWKKETDAEGQGDWVDARSEDDAAVDRWRR